MLLREGTQVEEGVQNTLSEVRSTSFSRGVWGMPPGKFEKIRYPIMHFRSNFTVNFMQAQIQHELET